ncbi:MAG: hypothetical protein H6Q07_1749 [Acidobacteria bacterium]|nr:hypothetical protein [Acidobacteriota bacterium]
MRVLRTVIEREPEYPDACRLLAALYAARGQPAEAETALHALEKFEKK